MSLYPTVPVKSVVLILLTVICGSRFTSSESRFSVDWNVPVTGPEGGHLNWYEIKADPEDSTRLIVCGAVRDAEANAYYGVVYASRDSGRSWRTVLKDTSSSWVSEQSCAFGKKHVAYFVSEASKVIDGRLNHSLGTSRIFVSFDSGQTWRQSATTGWADYSTSVVAGGRDGSQQDLYVFYNGNSQYDAARHQGNTIEYFIALDNGAKVTERRVVPGIVEKNYAGVYPSSSVVLKDGSILAIYNGRVREPSREGALSLDLGVARIGSDGAASATIIARHTTRDDPLVCPFSISNSLAYDPLHNRLYAIYDDAAPGYCALMLSKSDDGGKSWSMPSELRVEKGLHSAMYFPLVAVNRDGLLGILWRGKPEGSPDCWLFSIFDGKRIEQTTLLASCFSDLALDTQSSSYLATVISRPEKEQEMSVSVLTYRDYLTRVGITATADGAFHPIWSVLGNGKGELRTATIKQQIEPGPSGAETFRSTELEDITDRIAVLYAGQRLDHETKQLLLDLSLRNIGKTPISGPLLMHIDRATSDFGTLGLVNSPDSLIAGGYVDLSESRDGPSLLPHQQTLPFRLRLAILKEDSPVLRRFFVVQLKLQFFCRPAGAEPH